MGKPFHLKPSRLKPLRLILALVLPGVLIVLGLSFPQFVLQTIILPTATVLWLLLRIFVLSIDQQVYWYGMIGVAMTAAVVVLLRGSGYGPFSYSYRQGAPGDPIRRWKDSLLLNVHSDPDKDSFRRDLAWLLTWLHASARPGFANYQVREAFLQGRIPLPKSIHDFLFFDTRPPDRVPSFFTHPAARIRMAFESMARTMQRRARRRSGREAADYFHSIDEVLSFMEASMEMNHEHEPDA